MFSIEQATKMYKQSTQSNNFSPSARTYADASKSSKKITTTAERGPVSRQGPS